MFVEFRFAARTLARWRGGLAVAVVTLAVGIGTMTSLYALVRTMMAELPGVPGPDRVGRVYAVSPSFGVDRAPVALNEFDGSLSRASTFSAIGAYAEADVTVGIGNGERRVTGGFATPSFFSAIGVPPAAGRVFSTVDVGAAQPVALVSERFWRERFDGGDLGTAILTVNGVDRAVVGVMPAHFAYDFAGISAEVWIPLGRAAMDVPLIVSIFGRLRDDSGWPAAAAELDALGRNGGQWRWRAIPLTEDARRRTVGAFTMTLAPALIVLLLACANVASMLMARGIAREKELTVRRALGASRARVLRQLLAEHGLLAVAGGVLGCALAAVLLRVVAAAAVAVGRPAIAGRIALDWPLLLAAVAASALAALVFGVLPALRLSRQDVAASLNGVPSPHRFNFAGYGARDLVVFVEVGSAVALIVFAAMLFNLFKSIHLVRPGFAADRVIAMRVAATDLDGVMSRVAAIPGIASVSASSGMLGGRAGSSAVRAQADDGRVTMMSRVPVRGAFLETLGLPVLRGRSFDASELQARSGAAVLTETAARALFPAGDAIGERIQLTGHASETLVVIGICRDAMEYGSLSRAGLISPDVYVPFDGTALEAVVLARAAADAHAFVRAVADTAPARAGQLRAKAVVVADEPALGDRADAVIVVRLVGGFALAALLLAATGVFGVISHSVAQRTRELGIRLAIGATPRRVLGLVVAREARLILAAVATGAVFIAALTHVMFEELAALSVAAPPVWLALVGLCGGTAALACLLATWRIVRLDPAAVLRRG
jgi:predicted permease